ncbi:hypothetical protein HanXRQr2_Chr16g0723261 [Helianthus annuus]|uniref:Uncharacterized protein n=1 Tax=Helianthus annuus TaxID=4232 RepID=A0A9K3DMB5_HELAN|nr:hypothetical protein HanXRQr2_Chr16g0723261 [Helianthus annuus]KAJ0819231.1 hypothetical protein HanPSC8_Chr16g0693741 [Helianthus annuus]
MYELKPEYSQNLTVLVVGDLSYGPNLIDIRVLEIPQLFHRKARRENIRDIHEQLRPTKPKQLSWFEIQTVRFTIWYFRFEGLMVRFF